MTREEILSHVDHTLLKPEATWPQIQVICDEAVENHTASICINTCYVRQAVEYLAGRIPVCCVVGFPLGAMDTESKAFEAKKAIENGASEVDMVINIGRLKNKEYDAVREDIRAVKQAVGDKVLKVIIETCLLTDEEKEKMCDIVCEAGADYIKTSTGFSTAGLPRRGADGQGCAWPLQGQGCRRHLHRGRYGKVPRAGRGPSGHFPRGQAAERRTGKGLLSFFQQKHSESCAFAVQNGLLHQFWNVV